MILVYLRHELACFSATQRQIDRFNSLLKDDNAVMAINEEDFLKKLPEATSVIVWTFKQEWFSLAVNLRHLYTPAAGKDYFKVIPPDNVTMHYGTFHGEIMGETALGAILGMTHGLIPFATAMKESDSWPRRELVQRCDTLYGKTVLIMGFGNIGKYLAQMLTPFNLRLICITYHPHPEYRKEYPDSYTFATLDEVDNYLPNADHIVCILPSGKITDNLLSEERLSIIKPTAYIYNFGRGNLIDESALAQKLSEGKIAGAVLDVFQTEPLPATSALRSAPNCYLYPHSSAFSPSYLDLYFDSLVQ